MAPWAPAVFLVLSSPLVFFHVRMNFTGNLYQSFFCAKQFFHKVLRPQDAFSPDSRVEEKMREIQLQNYKLICKWMSHLVLPSCLFALYEAVWTPSISTIGTFFPLFFAYLQNVAVGTELVQVTPKRMKIACYMIHSLTLLLAAFSSLGSPDLLTFSYNKPWLATTRLVLLGFVDKSVTIPFNILHAVVDVASYFLIFEDVWPSIFSILTSEVSFTLASISVSFIVDVWVRSRIEALLETADADSLMSSFRRMLRGVCDGEVLLDSDYKICGEGKCLQHLIMTTVSMANKSFEALLVEEERERFADFIRSSTEAGNAASPTTDSCPVCSRVSLRGTVGTRVAVDLYHVPIAGLYGASEPFHLIAFKEDSECRGPPDAPENFPPAISRVARTMTAGSRSRSSRSSGSSSAAPEPEVQQMAMLVDVNTELQDVVELHMNFQRNDEMSLERSSMPSLRKMIRPTDWRKFSSKVMKFADEVFWNPQLPTKALRPLAVRLPEEHYILAQRASISTVAGPESGSKVWIYLSEFTADRKKSQRLQPTLQNIQEGLRNRNPATDPYD